MADSGEVVAETALSRPILLCAVFIRLNTLDAWLTGLALGLGSYELNHSLGMRFSSNILVKGLIPARMGTALVLFKRGRLLKLLSLGMLLICAWNGLAIWFWS